MSSRKVAHSHGARWRIRSLKSELESLYIRADPRSISDLELAADLGRYLCIRVSGFLEQATAEILREHFAKNSWGPTQQFGLSHLDKMPNLNADALLKLVRRFTSEWATELEAFLAVEERRSSLNALVGIRNDVAHGKQQGLSRERAWGYFEVAEGVVQWLLDKFDPVSTT